MAWGPEGLKLFNPAALGDLLLTDVTDFGTVSAHAERGDATSMMWTLARQGSDQWLTASPRSAQTLELPAGSYCIDQGPLPPGETAAEFIVHSGQMTQVSVPHRGRLTVPLVPTSAMLLGPGTPRQVGPGRVTEEGGGKYQGSFHNMSNSDGLPDATVNAMLQDSDGGIWLATLNGVSRHDGQEFRTYTDRDGLCGKGVGAIAEDVQSRLWFGCDVEFSAAQGVTVFDGATATTYAEEDVLAGQFVLDIVGTADGSQWLLTSSSANSRLFSDLMSTTLQRVRGDTIYT